MKDIICSTTISVIVAILTLFVLINFYQYGYKQGQILGHNDCYFETREDYVKFQRANAMDYFEPNEKGGIMWRLPHPEPKYD